MTIRQDVAVVMDTSRSIQQDALESVFDACVEADGTDSAVLSSPGRATNVKQAALPIIITSL